MHFVKSTLKKLNLSHLLHYFFTPKIILDIKMESNLHFFTFYCSLAVKTFEGQKYFALYKKSTINKTLGLFKGLFPGKSCVLCLSTQSCINTQNMRNSNLVYVSKMEYVHKVNIFDLKMMVKSGLKKLF